MKRISTISILFVGVILFTINNKKTTNDSSSIEEEFKREDSPQEFLKFHQGIRTREDQTVPDYQDNYQLKELSKARSLNKSKSYAARTQSTNGVIEWVERGPGNVPGRTRGLLVDPDDPIHKTWYAGSASGGIWKTTDAGVTWTWLTSELPNLATTTLAMAASNHNIIYAGTGEGFGSFEEVGGHGVFKSTDRGATWTLVNGTEPMQAINRIIINPNNADNLIVASNTGIYVTSDGGSNWTKTFIGWVQDLKETPENFNIIYATQFGVGVLKSIDGGNSWQLSNTGMNPSGRVEIDVSPIKNDRIFASSQGKLSGSNSDLYMSDDAGATWNLVGLTLSNKNLNYLGDQGWYDNTIKCDPFDKDYVYVGGIGIYKIQITGNGVGTVVGSYTMEEVNTTTFILLVNFGSDAYGGKLDVGPSANKTNVEIRFGPGKSQKAHRFLVPDGSTSGVPDANYSYQNYIIVPFEVWDIDNNRQLMVSFRDQDRNGEFNLYPFNSTGDPTSQSREYIYINNVTYDPDFPNSSIATDGGHMYMLMYNIWPFLNDVATWDPSSLPASTLRFNYSEITMVSSSTVSVSDSYSEYDGKNNWNYVHPDQHNIVVIPESKTLKTYRLLIANDGGIFLSKISTTPGTNQGDWSMVGNGYNTSQFYGADKRPGYDQYIGGMQDNSTYFTPNGIPASASTFYNTNAELRGDGFEVIWNNLDDKKMIGGSQFNDFARSQDGGNTWYSAINGLTKDQSKYPFISKLSNSRQAPDIIFTVGSEGVWRSNDFGGSWKLTPITDKWGLTTFLDVEVSRANANIIWAGSGMSSARSLFVSTDGGTTFSPTKVYPNAALGNITKLASHPLEEKTAYAIFSIAKSPKILITKDLGQTWEDISGFNGNNSTSTKGFPDVAVYCLYVRPDNPNIIWAGTEIGIVETLDGGNSWALIEDFPNVSVWDLKGQDDQVIIATHGRGIWTAKIEAEQTLQIKNPKILSLGTSPKSRLVIKIKLEEDFDSTQVWINNSKVGTLQSVAQGEYIVDVTNGLYGNLTAKLISYMGTSPIHSSIFSGKSLLLNPIQAQYFNYFINGDDFSLDNFLVQSFGSSNSSLKTPSNYGLNEEYIATLIQPIKITADHPYFYYRDVAIVEPAATGAVFGEENFKDYVVVEATKDGVNWIPLEDGYDANYNGNWLAAFNSAQPGNNSLFIDHTIDLTSRFNVGDTLLFRFRLHSNSTISAWGWAIDDLYIQQMPTGVAETSVPMGFVCYPNPTNGNFIISYGTTKKTNTEITVHDLHGKLVFNKKRDDVYRGTHEEQISLNLSDGVYLVRLRTVDGVEVKKIIIRQ